MKRIFTPFILSLSLIFIMMGCAKESELTNDIQGKWLIKTTDMNGTILPADGSFLIFMGGYTDCKGTDYSSQTGTVGSFSYSFNSTGDELIITDESEDGGDFNYCFKVLDFTETTLQISTPVSDLGQVTFTFEKE